MKQRNKHEKSGVKHMSINLVPIVQAMWFEPAEETIITWASNERELDYTHTYEPLAVEGEYSEKNVENIIANLLKEIDVNINTLRDVLVEALNNK